MTKVQHILKEIDELDASDQAILIREIFKRVDQKKRVDTILNKYRGVGKGIWDTDAQTYINRKRSQDRV